MKPQFSTDPALESFANELIATGIAAVISPETPTTYYTIYDGTNFVYIQKNICNFGYDFSKSYAVTGAFGTGQGIMEREELTKENAKRAFTWLIHGVRQYYPNLATFIKANNWQSLNFTDINSETTLYSK